MQKIAFYPGGPLHSVPPSPETLDLAEKILGWFDKRLERDAAAVLAAIPTPDPLPLLDLDNAQERFLARWTLRGYVAGLARGERPWAARIHGSTLLSVPDSMIHETATMFAQMRRAWEHGYRQAQEHRARAMEQDAPAGVFTLERLRAAQTRLEPLPA